MSETIIPAGWAVVEALFLIMRLSWVSEGSLFRSLEGIWEAPEGVLNVSGWCKESVLKVSRKWLLSLTTGKCLIPFQC